MSETREPAGNNLLSGGSRRHVGGARHAAVKPWKSGRCGRETLHTMYVGRDVESSEIRGVRRIRIIIVCKSVKIFAPSPWRTQCTLKETDVSPDGTSRNNFAYR
jgi:hypothetical protein